MSLCLVLLALFGACAGEKSVPSVDFNSDSEIEFGKSVVENEVAGDEYLRNFKSLHNSTDLEALASETEPSATDVEDAVSRADTGTRVLRGAGHDFALDHPLFTPYKHNKIDTADFSDCALQGEWKPIGVPHHHYGHHEDTQKEHFHHAAPDGHDSFSGHSHSPDSFSSNSHSPDSFPGNSHSPDSFHGNSHSPESFSGNSHSPLDEEGLSFWNQLLKETHGSHGFPKHVKHHRKPKPPHHVKQNHRQQQHHHPRPVQDIDVFENLRNPGADSNFFHIQEKPVHADALLPQSLIANQPPFNDVELALLQATSHEGAQPNHQPAQHQVIHHNDDFLSPPPAPHRFHVGPKPKPPHSRPKHVHKVHQKAKPHRPPPPPPPVIEHPDDHSNARYPVQIPAESSTFTCGHNHAEGTNYHTASYQVEGESDPALLAEEITGSNYLSSPIIVGQPAFEHSFENTDDHRFPKQEHADLEEEGTETGDNDEDILKQVKQFSPFGQKIESSTQSDNLETTAPQIFHQENENTPEKVKESQFDVGFDHSGVFDVSVNAFPASSEQNERINFKKPEIEFQQNNPHQEQAHSHSEQFASHFPVSFAEFDIKNHRPPPKKHYSNPPPSSFSEINFPPFQPGKPFKAGIAVSEHGPSFNHTKSHQPPRRKRPHKQYEVNENSGEMIPPSAFFPPKKMPKQFDMRKPNFAVPKSKRPKNAPPPPKYQSTVHFDGSNLGVYQSRPRQKVTKIRLKAKPSRGNGPPRFSEPDFRKSLTIKSRIR